MKNSYRNGLMATALAMTAMLPTSCSHNDEPVSPAGGTVQVELSAQIGKEKAGKVFSRTDSQALTRVANNQWELNDMVGMYMITDDGALPDDLVSDDDGAYDNRRYRIVEGATAGTFKLTAATQEDAMYYPEDKSTVDFIAYYPYVKTLTDYKYPLDIQTQDGSLNHDLLYSTDGTGSITSATGNITFEHQLSKLVVKLKPLQSTLNFSTMTGKVEKVPVTGKFSLVDATITDVASGTIDVPTNYTEKSGLNFDGTPYQEGVGTEMNYTCFDIILIPHASGTGRQLNFSTLTKNYFWTLPDDLEFDGGKEYTVILEIDGSTLNTVSVTIKQWGVGEETLSIPMVKIPAAGKSFWMGSPDGTTEISYNGDDNFLPDADPLINDAEKPMHEVTFTDDFYMSKTEITAAQYCLFLNAAGITSATAPAALAGTDEHDMTYDFNGKVLFDATNAPIAYANNKWSSKSGKDTHPMSYVTWYGAFAFANWAGGSLPTEAQWEYAARGGDYFFGNIAYRWASFDEKALPDYAWYTTNNTPETGAGYAAGTKPVGLKLPNKYGLYDIHGNVWEWCYDGYDATYYTGNSATDPVNTTEVTNRVLRGGAYNSAATRCRSANRGSDVPASVNSNYGFRVVFPIQ